MREFDKQYELGFWNSFGEKHKKETTIYPEEYKDSEILSFACTQTSLSTKEQNKLVDKWCAFLPTLKNVKYLFFYSRINQNIFDSICKVTNLEGLWIKWGAIKHLNSISNLRKIRHLYLGSSSQVESIESLIDLGTLNGLHLENFKKINSFRELTTLNELTELGIFGSIWTCQSIDTVTYLADFKGLKYLDLSNTRIKDKNIRILANLKDLEFLSLPFWYPKSDFEYLFNNLPNLKKGAPITVMTDEEFCKMMNIK